MNNRNFFLLNLNNITEDPLEYIGSEKLKIFTDLYNLLIEKPIYYYLIKGKINEDKLEVLLPLEPNLISEEFLNKFEESVCDSDDYDDSLFYFVIASEYTLEVDTMVINAHDNLSYFIDKIKDKFDSKDLSKRFNLEVIQDFLNFRIDNPNYFDDFIRVKTLPENMDDDLNKYEIVDVLNDYDEYEELFREKHLEIRF